jgi:hypothetical protein
LIVTASNAALSGSAHVEYIRIESADAGLWPVLRTPRVSYGIRFVLNTSSLGSTCSAKSVASSTAGEPPVTCN